MEVDWSQSTINWSEVGSASKSLVGADPCVCPFFRKTRFHLQDSILFTQREMQVDNLHL
jgi:hypothetical protein